MNRRAFTMVETLCAVGIIVVLAAIVFPVTASAKEAALKTSTASNARQLAMGLSLYRTEYEGDAVFGKASTMGLPPFEQIYKIAPLVDSRLWKTPCKPPVPGDTPADNLPPDSFTYWPDDKEGAGSWAELTVAFEDATPVVATPNCTEPGHDIRNPFHTKVGIAATLGGSLLKRTRIGNPDHINFWID